MLRSYVHPKDGALIHNVDGSTSKGAGLRQQQFGLEFGEPQRAAELCQVGLSCDCCHSLAAANNKSKLSFSSPCCSLLILKLAHFGGSRRRAQHHPAPRGHFVSSQDCGFLAPYLDAIPKTKLEMIHKMKR